MKQSVSASDLRVAHRQLARVLHPDRQTDASAAERRLADRRMREVNAAWTVLSDPERRAEYDRTLRAARTNGPSAGSNRSSSTSGRHPGGSAPKPPVVDDEDDAFDIEDLPPHLNLLRRGPLLLVLVTAALIFVVTAYAGSSARSAEPGLASSTTSAPADCVRIVDPNRRTGVRTACGDPAHERLITTVAQPLDCPDRTRYVIVDHVVMCSTSDPSVASNNISGD